MTPSSVHNARDCAVLLAASGLWTEITPLSDVNPSARKGHTWVVSGSVFIMYGGYGNNVYNQEFWFYNTSTWLLCLL